MKDKLLRIKQIFYTLTAIFIVLVLYFGFPSPVSAKRALFPFIAVYAFIFFILGSVLVYLTFKLKIKGSLKNYLLLTGGSSVLFLISVILHNFIYGLFIVLLGDDFWIRTGIGDEFVFFLIALIICPILFFIGMIGSIVMLKKK